MRPWRISYINTVPVTATLLGWLSLADAEVADKVGCACLLFFLRTILS
jgi:hypothetical protein